MEIGKLLNLFHSWKEKSFDVFFRIQNPPMEREFLMGIPAWGKEKKKKVYKRDEIGCTNFIEISYGS